MPTYKTILTNVGAAKIAAAIAASETVNLTQMAVGDGNGNPTTPVATQTALVREVFRASINMLAVDPLNPNYVIPEMIIPSNVGGWPIWEVGVFDDEGDLIAVGNFPGHYKPILSEGAAFDFAIRTIMQVASADAITLIIDPAIVLASRKWVIDNFTFAVQMPGGTTGQVLAKQSNADGDADWVDAGEVTVNISTRQEIQTGATSQTVFNLATCTTEGLAVYVEGARIFDVTVLSATQVQLPTDYPGKRILFIQNDPNAPLRIYGVETWQVVPSGNLLAAGALFVPDNGSAACSYNLPANPANGDAVEWIASSTPFSTNKMTLNRNGKTIMGLSENMDVTEDQIGGRLVWRQALNTWRVYETSVAGTI